jgi:hypothetical protein
LAGSAPGLQHPAQFRRRRKSRGIPEATAASQPSVPSLAAIKDRSYGQMHTATGPGDGVAEARARSRVDLVSDESSSFPSPSARAATAMATPASRSFLSAAAAAAQSANDFPMTWHRYRKALGKLLHFARARTLASSHRWRCDPSPSSAS